MNYKFIQEDLDNYKLVYTNFEGKEVTKEFKVDIDTGVMVDSVTKNARFQLALDLAKVGKTKNDLVVKTNDGKGHITEDESNYLMLEEAYMETESVKLLDNLSKKFFGMSYENLLLDMGIDYNNITDVIKFKVQAFNQEFLSVVTGRGRKEETPRKSIATKE